MSRIRFHAHCRTCMKDKPTNQAPSQWQRTESGLTDTGLQIWCRRCRKEVAHFTPADLEAQLASAECEWCPGGGACVHRPPTPTG